MNHVANPVENPWTLERLSVACDYDGGSKTPPAGNGGLTTNPVRAERRLASMIATPTGHVRPTLTVPVAKVENRCCDLGPRFSCNRPAGHTGRHSYIWRNAGPLSGRVRGVWS